MSLRAEAAASLRLNAKKLENSRNRALVETLPIAPGHMAAEEPKEKVGEGVAESLRGREASSSRPRHPEVNPSAGDHPFRSREQQLNSLMLAQRVQMKSSQALNDNRLMGMRYWLCDQEMLHPPPEIHTYS